MARVRVGLLGASGETGGSILMGLIEDGGFDIVALVRPASLPKPVNVAIKDKGVELRALDLGASEDSIVKALEDIEILISAIGPGEQLTQVPLATASKKAGVKRFVPCGYTTIMPVGVHIFRDQKEDVYNHVKRLHLPYTIIDVGWWYQSSFPELPSGRIDYAMATIPGLRIPGDGNVPSALTDLRDIGKYVARIVKDDRTLNAMVFVHNEVWTGNQAYELLEKMSGEQVSRMYVSAEECEYQIAEAEAKLEEDLRDPLSNTQRAVGQYFLSWGIRGDNTPEYARYLGYLDGKKLYPDLQFTSYEDYLQEVLDGKAPTVYDNAEIEVPEAYKRSHQGVARNHGLD